MILKTQKAKKKTNVNNSLETIKNRTWKYFAIYIALLLLVIWLIQNVFLNTFYTNLKVAEIEELGAHITTEYTQDRPIDEIVRKNSFDNSIRIQVIDANGNVIYPMDWLGIFYSTTYNKDLINAVLSALPMVEGSSSLYNVGSKEGGDQTLLYTSYLGKDQKNIDDRYLMIVALVRPIDSTINILQQQFPFIIAIAFIIGILTSYFMAERLSNPVRNLTTSAEILAKGNYDVIFPDSDLYELDRLSKTLNYATEELQKMDQMRVSIVANVSHDLKTPLTVIKSYAEMIKDITGDNRERRNEDLDTIISEADRLTDMVNSILDVSKLEMQMDELNLTKFSLRELTEEIIERFKVLSSRDKYIFEIEGNSEGVITADREMIDQVIYNFASNAVSFVGPDKKVIFRIDEDEAGTITYSVIDHGRGINKDEQDKIWERYYTDHHNHVRNVVGTGIGLHIVRVILNKHGFNVGVDSEPTKGSRFYFEVKK